jgi:hypothetical protein
LNKIVLLFLVIIVSNSYAMLEKDAYEKYSLKDLRTTKNLISIIRANNVMATCEEESKRRGLGGFRGAIFEACSFNDTKTTCTIVVGWETNNDILGHEVRHCFVGRFH